MPVSKNAAERYRLYDRLFREARPLGYCYEEIEPLLKEKKEKSDIPRNLTPQQFKRDINNMITLFFDGDESQIVRTVQNKRAYFTYRDKTRGIDMNSRTFEMLFKLSKMDGLGIEDSVEELCRYMGVQRTSNPIISYEAVKNLEGIKHLLPFYSYIQNKQVIEIDFWKEFTEKETYIIHPYHLRRYNGRWYLFGWNPDAHQLYNIALDRVDDYREKCGVIYEEATSHSIQFGGDNDYYKDVIGVTRLKEKAKTQIFIRFSEKSFEYVRTKPLHPSQKEKIKERTVTIEVFPNYELDSVILSFGKNAEVLSPPFYREHIKEIVAEMAMMYKDE